MKKLLIKILVLFVLLGIPAENVFAWSFKDFGHSNSEEEVQQVEKVAAAHILVRDAATAVMIKKELDKGGSFEYYAKKYSLCPSGQKGGYLGYFERGQMVPEFEHKAFSMEIGEISTPVRTNFGWHIIKLLDKQ